MKTETVNIEKWNFEVNYEGREDNPVCEIIDSSKPYFQKPLAKVAKEKDAELIVTAVNACKEINKDNPLNVAKAIHLYVVRGKYCDFAELTNSVAVYLKINQQ